MYVAAIRVGAIRLRRCDVGVMTMVLVLDVTKVHGAAVVAIISTPRPLADLRVRQGAGLWRDVGVAEQHREVRYRAACGAERVRTSTWAVQYGAEKGRDRTRGEVS